MTQSPDESQIDVEESEHFLPSHAVDRAVRFSYAQVMLSAVYVASTGGMFIIGYALKLGANNAQIGLLSTVPMLCEVAQLISSMVVERGYSRRSLSVLGSVLNVAGWLFIIMLPVAGARLSAEFRIFALIGIIALVTVFAHLASNARASWIGDLIPPRRRGTFFGRAIMYAGIIGAMFAIIEGLFLDRVKGMGMSAFSWLFVFGMAFGLASAMLFVPQPDIPLRRDDSDSGFAKQVRQTFSNSALMVVVLYAILWSMQAIAAPFYATYLLRDLKMPFVGVGIINAVATITALTSSPFWGRIVDRYGCRPVLVLCTAIIIPMPLAWIWIRNAQMAYAIACPVNLLGGFVVAGISVSLSTLIYKVIPAIGRSVQLAVYSIVVVLAVAPLPTIGGHLPDWLNSLGIGADIRCTFYVSAIFILLATLMARRIHEPDAAHTGDMMRNLPDHLRRPESLKPAK
jgi:hypothetical protein